MVKETLLHLVGINFDLCNIQSDVNAVQERVMVVMVLVAESPEAAIVGALWPTIVPVLGLLTVLVPFELVAVNSALMKVPIVHFKVEVNEDIWIAHEGLVELALRVAVPWIRRFRASIFLNLQSILTILWFQGRPWKLYKLFAIQME